MKQLSIIIPYVQESPQILFTIRSIHEQLKDKIDHEIIVIDNLSEDAKAQLKQKNKKIDMCHEHTDKTGKIIPSHIETMIKTYKYDWLKYIHCDDYFSCWQARNQGILNSNADTVMFIDAHCVPGRDSILNMFNYYNANHQKLNGSIHLPLTYHILENRRLIYDFKYNKEHGQCTYTFVGFKPRNDVFEVPCMSSCGLMCRKSQFDDIGLFPQRGIYSGGEQFFNYVSGILGYKKWIYDIDGAALHHHGAERDYNYTWNTYQENRAVANYMFGGEEWLELYLNTAIDSLDTRSRFKDKILNDIEYQKQRQDILSKQKFTIEEWREDILERLS